LIGIAFFSGYRLLWLLTAAIPLLIPVISTQRLRRVKRVLGAAVLILLFASAVLLTARYFAPDLYALFTDKVRVLVYDFRFGESTRYYAWRAAWGHFLESPLVGKGIGSEFSYWALNSIGGLYLRTGTTHNILLSLLYQSGIFGAGIFVFMHFWILWHLMRQIPRLTPESRVLVAGLVAGYLAALVVAMFQPGLESPGTVVVLYIWIGVMFKVVESYLAAAKQQAQKHP
jgi:O-antigen ligase